MVLAAEGRKANDAHKNTDSSRRVNHYPCDPRQQEPYDQYHENSHAKHWDYHKTPLIGRSEERFSRNAETDLVCRLLLEKKNFLSRDPRVANRHQLLQAGVAANRKTRLE